MAQTSQKHHATRSAAARVRGKRSGFDALLRPKSIAVAAADKNVMIQRDMLVDRLSSGLFDGAVYTVCSAEVQADCKDILLSKLPGIIDLAVLVGCPGDMGHLVEECIRSRVRAVMMLSGGPAKHCDPADVERTVTRLHNAGIRLLGPNSLGTVTTANDDWMNVSYIDDLPQAGELAIGCQGGALGVAMLRQAMQAGLGISTFISLGEETDVTCNEMLEYWEHDKQTKYIALQIEAYKSPRKFMRIARRMTAFKPLMILECEHSKPHRDLLLQAGVIPCDSAAELLGTAALLPNMPPLDGRRCAIVTNTAGGAKLAANRLKQFRFEPAGRPNDLGPCESGHGFGQAVSTQMRNPNVDAVLILYAPIGVANESEVLGAIAESIQTNQTKPVIPVILSGGMDVRSVYVRGVKLPVYGTIELAVAALGHAADYSDFLRSLAH